MQCMRLWYSNRFIPIPAHSSRPFVPIKYENRMKCDAYRPPSVELVFPMDSRIFSLFILLTIGLCTHDTHIIRLGQRSGEYAEANTAAWWCDMRLLDFHSLFFLRTKSDSKRPIEVDHWNIETTSWEKIIGGGERERPVAHRIEYIVHRHMSILVYKNGWPYPHCVNCCYEIDRQPHNGPFCCDAKMFSLFNHVTSIFMCIEPNRQQTIYLFIFSFLVCHLHCNAGIFCTWFSTTMTT